MSIPYTLPSFDGLPDSPTLAEFLEHPLDYKPLPEYATSVYIEVTNTITSLTTFTRIDYCLFFQFEFVPYLSKSLFYCDTADVVHMFYIHI